MKTLNLTVKGITPLLMNAFSETGENIDKLTPQEQCEKRLYWNEKKNNEEVYYFPINNLVRAIMEAGKYHKKGRGTLVNDIAAGLTYEKEYTELETSGWEVDSRPVVIKATGGRIMRHRPKFNDWQISAELRYDDKLFSEKKLREIIDDAGSKVGLLDFRPAKKGMFGKFMVTEWKIA